MRLAKYILGGVAVLLFLVIVVLILLRYGIIKAESYWNNDYYKKKCEETKYFDPGQFPISTPGQYSTALARYLMQMSFNVEASNCLNLGAIPTPSGFTNKTQITGKSYQNIEHPFAYAFSNNKSLLIVFSGTIFTDEWFEDFEVEQTFPSSLRDIKEGVLCHEGFYNIYSTLQDQINNVISGATGKTIYITGHSLGAGLATLCAYDLSYLKPILYTFSSPRVFNIEGAQILTTNLGGSAQRIYNTEDFFTSVPFPVAFGENYEHIGNGIGFTDNMGSLARNHTDAYLKFLNLSF